MRFAARAAPSGAIPGSRAERQPGIHRRARKRRARWAQRERGFAPRLSRAHDRARLPLRPGRLGSAAATAARGAHRLADVRERSCKREHGSYARRDEGPGSIDLSGVLNRADGREVGRYLPQSFRTRCATGLTRGILAGEGRTCGCASAATCAISRSSIRPRGGSRSRRISKGRARLRRGLAAHRQHRRRVELRARPLPAHGAKRHHVGRAALQRARRDPQPARAHTAFT